MTLKILLGASLIVVVASTGAYAADAVVSQEPAPYAAAPSFSWAGAYFGGQVGYGWGRAKLDDRTDGHTSEFKPDGFVGGLYTGYNFDMGNNVILGIDGNLDYDNLKKSHGYFTNGAVATTGKTELQWSGAVRARAGYAVDRFLPYIAGGVAFGGIKDSIAFGGNDFSKHRTQTGWTIGTGVDYAATDNILLRLEYRYTDYGKKDFGLDNLDTRGSFKTNDIRLGVAYKF